MLCAEGASTSSIQYASSDEGSQDVEDDKRELRAELNAVTQDGDCYHNGVESTRSKRKRRIQESRSINDCRRNSQRKSIKFHVFIKYPIYYCTIFSLFLAGFTAKICKILIL